MIRKNYRSDFTFDFTFYTEIEGEKVASAIPERIKLTFYTARFADVYEAGRFGEELVNASLSEDGMTLSAFIRLSRTKLGTGPLRCLVTEYIADEEFPGGYREEQYPLNTDILLWEGKSDELVGSAEIDLSVVAWVADNVAKTETAASEAEASAAAAAGSAENAASSVAAASASATEAAGSADSASSSADDASSSASSAAASAKAAAEAQAGAWRSENAAADAANEAIAARDEALDAMAIANVNLLALDMDSETGDLFAMTGGDTSAFTDGAVDPATGEVSLEFDYQ